MIEREKYPDKYWHCSIKIKGEERGWLGPRVLNDKNLDFIFKNLIYPFQRGRNFIFNGCTLSLQ